MSVSRRDFLKVSTAGAFLTPFGFDLTPAIAQAKKFKIARTTETRSICPYCSVSCGVIIHTLGDGKNTKKAIVHVEGDPDHPVNRGTLCPKGATLKDDIMNDRRLDARSATARRAPPTGPPISWDEAIEKIARRIKKTRDAGFVAKNAEGPDVNRLGHRRDRRLHRHQRVQLALPVKVARAWAIAHREQQARV